ncbi:MAG: hypothetical protein WEC80_01765 [Patescibacteria group bacterium]
MEINNSILNDKKTLIIFTYANVGFGHLRVTDAISQELKNNSNYIFLRGEDKVVSFFHRITSIHPALRIMFEWLQNGKAEDVLTFFYKTILFLTSGKLEKKLKIVIKQTKKPIKKVIIIATHFSLAHQIARVRKALEREMDIQLFLIVQVTDDSPQHMWFVKDADLIFVPSEYTKKGLESYGKKDNQKLLNIKVLPYPVSETLTKSLTTDKYKKKLFQYDLNSEESIRMIIPISGAAVGMKYFINFIDSLFKSSQRFKIHIILKRTPYTQFFIKSLKNKKQITLKAYKQDTKVIDAYENIYKKFTFGFEITKPSEQAFKALVDTSSLGGPILLFTKPVGRQEYDNLRFLRRNKLIPSKNDQKYLQDAFLKDLKLDSKILNKAKYWRGLRLFEDPNKSVKLILWCLKQGVFKQMGNFRQDSISKNSLKFEIRPDGVHKFWEEVEAYIRNYKKT